MIDDEKQNRINMKQSRLAKDALQFRAERLHILQPGNFATFSFCLRNFKSLKMLK